MAEHCPKIHAIIQDVGENNKMVGTFKFNEGAGPLFMLSVVLILS